VTAHDGFTLRDLVSYNDKHNEANGEENRDGSDDNLSWNCGAEGETNDSGVNALRARQQRNFLTTLMLSQGTPMLLHGDEAGRTQRGNNNVYCQDNEISWQPWELDEAQEELLDWTRRVVAFRNRHPVLRRRNYFRGRPIRGEGLKDISWLRPDGGEMTEADWQDGERRTIGMWLAGSAADLTDEEGTPVRDDNLLILMNAHHEACDFALPAAAGRRGQWSLALDTAHPELEEGAAELAAGERFAIEPRSMAVLVNTPDRGRRGAKGREREA